MGLYNVKTCEPGQVTEDLLRENDGILAVRHNTLYQQEAELLQVLEERRPVLVERLGFPAMIRPFGRKTHKMYDTEREGYEGDAARVLFHGTGGFALTRWGWRSAAPDLPGKIEGVRGGALNLFGEIGPLGGKPRGSTMFQHLCYVKNFKGVALIRHQDSNNGHVVLFPAPGLVVFIRGKWYLVRMPPPGYLFYYAPAGHPTLWDVALIHGVVKGSEPRGSITIFTGDFLGLPRGALRAKRAIQKVPPIPVELCEHVGLAR